MKKIIIILALSILTICIVTRSTTIPKESIRFRIIAQDNTIEEQQLKKQILLNLKEEINKIEKNSANINKSRYNIKKELPEIKRIIENTIHKSGIDKQYSIKYGLNYFPKKQYEGKVYEEGQYESLVITIEEGKGDNFWCVLFPPLCLIDTQEAKENIEYKSFIKELINKYF